MLRRAIPDEAKRKRHRCKSVTTDAIHDEDNRCKRTKGHKGPHIAKQVGYYIAWFDGTFIWEAKVPVE